ncbi:dna replication regulator sld2 [Diplodia corticola]|uniref:DNA replication regulator SLD2 n=1 Tax=Diplodia corticola TaxID=236234 RepID=A0A1J9QUB6_9PEZI|nr:dna replication regulator sld2 [Diplodia corticola]OJD32558.1 dna replication regulator sld2 [Diplodia corticola]
MATLANPEYAQQCTAIRVELKAWEKSFQTANAGRKAGRADIKATPHIAAKYKEYHKLRDILDGKSKPQPASPKRKADPSAIDIYQTPTKKVKHIPVTNDSELREPRDDLLHLSPTKLFSPAAHELGPTPQKDGILLGLFDLLPTESPNKPQRTVLGDITANSHLQTPQKKRRLDFDDDDENELVWSGKMARKSRTPVSEGKRHFLDKFATPQKPKRQHDEGTPSSRGQPTTPAFLRRNFRPMPSLTENPTSPRMPRKPMSFTRTLSTILQERRKEKEEDARQEAEAKRQAELEAEAELAANDPDEDEEEAMREMENGPTAAPAPRQAPSTVLVQDSQFDRKLGADGENFSDSEPSEGENGPPRKVWKKKGAKRQTRRVNMRPVRTRPQPQQPQPAAADSEDESDATVAETQPAQPANEDFDDSDSTAVEDDGNESEHTPKKRKVGSSGKKQPTKAAAAKGDAGEKKENVMKKATRKISAQAHANFKKLKIKNKNSKAGGRGWGRNRR